jgi:hypothetical protein
MKKLINKYKLLSDNPTDSAEECKKVSISFGKYLVAFFKISMENNKSYTITDQELFDKFIESYYGKE